MRSRRRRNARRNWGKDEVKGLLPSCLSSPLVPKLPFGNVFPRNSVSPPDRGRGLRSVGETEFPEPAFPNRSLGTRGTPVWEREDEGHESFKTKWIGRRKCHCRKMNWS